MIAALTLLACEPEPPPEPGVLVVVQEQTPSWVRNFNPLLSAGGARWPSRNGIYETLMIFNGARSEWEPWLATGYRYVDAQTLAFDLRDGVSWSDGQPFEAVDVKFTFDLLLSRKELDLGGLASFVSSVEAPDADTVVFHLSRPYSPGLTGIAHQPIVPEHVWASIPDPLSFTNPDPVATGPFTEVDVFRPQVFQLGRNPHYWQPLALEALRFPAVGTNDQLTMALLNGEVDWAGAFVPAIDRIFVARDPVHNHYWFPLVGEMIFLYPNTTVAPFDDVRVRKALSLAIDRELLVKVAMYDYTRPADPTGLSDVYETWRSEAVSASGDWVTFDPVRAGALLDEAGLKLGPDGKRLGPDGEPLVIELSSVSGWSDWVRASQVISRNLADVGVEVKVRSYDFGAWLERLGRGDFALTVSWSPSGPTPYELYRGLMSAKAARPIGEAADKNWHRYASAEMDELLYAFEHTTDRDEQHRLSDRMQALFVRDAPAIPLFPSPSWGEFRTERFEGFPSAADPYARLSPNHAPDPLLVMTHVRPKSLNLVSAP